MPLDPNIILAGQRNAPDAMDSFTKMVTMKSLMGQQQLHDLQTQQLTRDMGDEQTLRDVYRGAIKPDGSIDQQALFTGVAQRGLGSKLPAIQEGLLKVEQTKAVTNKDNAEANKNNTEALKTKLTMAGGAINSLLAIPNVTADHVVQTIANLVRTGVIDQQQGGEMIRQVPGNPQALRQFLMQKGLEVMDAQKRMELLTPKVEYKDTGKKLEPVDTNSITNPNPVALGKTTTPGEDLQANVTVRGQNVTDKRERELAAGHVTYESDANGNVVAVPTNVAPGTMPKAQPVLAPGSGMQPLQGKGGQLTEDQGKATSWLIQATNAFNNMKAVIAVNPNAATPGPGDAIAAIPFGKQVGNYMRSSDRQKFTQATSSLTEALLRAASGANVPVHEAQQKAEELTPVWGDTDARVKQKLDSIPLYIEALKIRAGPGARRAAAVVGSGTAPVAPAAAAPAAAAPGALGSGSVDFSVPTDIDSIIRKHTGGK